MIIELFIVFAIGAWLFYRWAVKNNDHFAKRNIPFDKPVFLMGSGTDAMLKRKNALQVWRDIYGQHEGSSVYGAFEFRNPVLVIKDPQMVKHIMIKDFEHFVNRNNAIIATGENILTNSLFFMQNEKWRDMRYTLSPAFTGSKLRQMFELILQNVDEAMAYLKTQQMDGGIELDVKDFSSRLTNDVIASTAFGLRINSFRDKENDFYVKAKKAANFSAWQQIKMVAFMLMPKLMMKFNVQIFDKDFTSYFMRLVLDAIKYRQEHKIHRPDMINLLMEARGLIPTEVTKTHYREWSDIDMVAQCFLFYFAGFEPSSGVMSFATLELVQNPEVQQKLYEEIQEIHEQLDGKPLSYDVLQKMPYLDMVLCEVLRKWPVTLVTDRLCNKDYVYETEEGQSIEIKKGDLVRFVMCAMQMDAKYFENPEVLDPERFAGENKARIENGGAYFPFGLGPRNCIGNRFALLEIKAFLYYLIRDYRLEPSAKTPMPLELDPASIQLKPKNGFWLNLVARK